jgi:hypothetical protein
MVSVIWDAEEEIHFEFTLRVQNNDRQRLLRRAAIAVRGNSWEETWTSVASCNLTPTVEPHTPHVGREMLRSFYWELKRITHPIVLNMPRLI